MTSESPDFSEIIAAVFSDFESFSKPVHTEKWQSIDISKRPDAEMREMINVYFQVEMLSEELDHYRREIKPNLPWADRHFELERASGKPHNPGETWKEWPYALSADKFRTQETFSHTYAERYWPKLAMKSGYPAKFGKTRHISHEGIRYRYGDLGSMISLLAMQPLTRQAYLPVWFPEDTGVEHGERVPCTLGYHFINRQDRLHVFYPIRSCDLVRHFRDDLYLTVRLLLLVLSNCRRLNPESWTHVKPGVFTFWCGSAHMFINDYRKLYGVKP